MENWTVDELVAPDWNDEMEFLGNDIYYDSYDSPATTIILKDFWVTLRNIWLILESILPVIFFFAIARVMNRKALHIIQDESIVRYLFEFLIITLPTVLFVIVLHPYLYAVNIVFAISAIFALYKIYKRKAQKRWYITGGRRPFILTLVRSTIFLITTLCILAEDFKSFPTFFKMTHGQNVGLKDALTGFYVFTMATVERNKLKIYSIKRTLKPLLLLWIVRLISVKYVIYSHDENVYGTHWNVFLTLAATKCIGSFYCFVFKSRNAQLFAGVVLLILHQWHLWIFFNNTTLDSSYLRENLFTKNREGLLSLPGFVGLYFVSVYIGRCLRIQYIILPYNDLIHKIKLIGIACLVQWMLVIGCASTISISHITCNIGYAAWILAMALTMIFVSMVVFHLIINTLWFIDEKHTYSEIYHGSILSSSDIPRYEDTLPLLVEAINKNGFIFFVLTILCARANVMISPMKMDGAYTFLILLNSLIFAIGIISLLHHFKYRIAL